MLKPDQWALAPNRASTAMLAAGEKAIMNRPVQRAEACWQAMWAVMVQEAREQLQAIPCRFCNGEGWEEDQNWEPAYPDVQQDRERGDGLIRCGHCLGDGREPYPALPQERR